MTGWRCPARWHGTHRVRGRDVPLLACSCGVESYRIACVLSVKRSSSHMPGGAGVPANVCCLHSPAGSIAWRRGTSCWTRLVIWLAGVVCARPLVAMSPSLSLSLPVFPCSRVGSFLYGCLVGLQVVSAPVVCACQESGKGISGGVNSSASSAISCMPGAADVERGGVPVTSSIRTVAAVK